MNISDPETLINLYDWLETIPFSRPKKNLSRDFSDGILAAELIKYFFPTLVDLHNYPGSNSVEQKKINWSTLNYKVLKKLDFPLSDMTISDLASGSKREATEYFLNTLREKIDFRMQRKVERMTKKKDTPKNTTKTSMDDVFKDTFISKDTASLGNMCDGIGESNFQTCEINELLRTKSSWNIGDSYLDNVPREIFDKKVQELLACEETILILKARIQRLEETLQLKNATIERQQKLLDKVKAENICIDKSLENRYQQRKAR